MVGKVEDDPRRARLGAALRLNLKRRKGQARAQRDADRPDDAATDADRPVDSDNGRKA